MSFLQPPTLSDDVGVEVVTGDVHRPRTGKPTNLFLNVDYLDPVECLDLLTDAIGRFGFVQNAQLATRCPFNVRRCPTNAEDLAFGKCSAHVSLDCLRGTNNVDVSHKWSSRSTVTLEHNSYPSSVFGVDQTVNVRFTIVPSVRSTVTRVCCC